MRTRTTFLNGSPVFWRNPNHNIGKKHLYDSVFLDSFHAIPRISLLEYLWNFISICRCRNFNVLWLVIVFVCMRENSVLAQGALKPIIQISANVFEYRLDGEKQLGLFYQYNRKNGSVQSSDLFLHGTENVKEQANRVLDLSGSFASFPYGSIDYNLKTAISEGRATLINHQRAMVADGKDFYFTVGEEIPLTVVEVKGLSTVLKTEDRPTGVKLRVTPRIFRDTNVLMDLEIESSEITRIDTFDRGDEQRYTLPVITKRNVKTVVIVPSESPVYVGGLYTDNTGDVTRKVPVVGDLPVIGFFLRGFNKQRRQTETIFRITPVIKAPGEGLDIGSSVFEELLQPDGDTSVIQDQALRETGSSVGNIPISATDTISSPTAVISPTDSLIIPSPIIRQATPESEDRIIPFTADMIETDRTKTKSRFGSSSKLRMRRN